MTAKANIRVTLYAMIITMKYLLQSALDAARIKLREMMLIEWNNKKALK